MGPRKPKDFFAKPVKSLRARYSEVAKLRELVKQAQSKTSRKLKIDERSGRR
jgi:hypothetical protein